jgi:hypothetical protein
LAVVDFELHWSFAARRRDARTTICSRAVGESGIEWFGIMRHAQAYRPHLGPNEIARGPDGLSRTGVREATAVADRLAETMLARTADAPDWTISNIHVLYAPTAPARETAALVAAAINKHWADLVRRGERENLSGSVGPAAVEVTEVAQLDPEGPGLTSVQLADGWSDVAGGEGPPPGLELKIGHDPQLTRRLHAELAAGRTVLTRRLAGRTSLERRRQWFVVAAGGRS